MNSAAELYLNRSDINPGAPSPSKSASRNHAPWFPAPCHLHPSSPRLSCTPPSALTQVNGSHIHLNFRSRPPCPPLPPPPPPPRPSTRPPLVPSTLGPEPPAPHPPVLAPTASPALATAPRTEGFIPAKAQQLTCGTHAGMHAHIRMHTRILEHVHDESYLSAPLHEQQLTRGARTVRR